MRKGNGRWLLVNGWIGEWFIVNGGGERPFGFSLRI